MTLKQEFDCFIGNRIPPTRQEDLTVRDNQRNALLITLNDAQKLMFEDYEDTQGALNGRWEFRAYTQGFIDGVQLTGGLL